MCEKENQIYYDDKRQCLWSERRERVIPIEEVGVERVDGYENRSIQR